MGAPGLAAPPLISATFGGSPGPMTSPLIEVQKYGQSIWYDYISRDLILSGELRRLVDQDGVLGVTSNPAIFEKAVSASSIYDPAIQAQVEAGASDPKSIFESLAIQDIQLGCDILRPVFERTAGADGFVSLEVSPHLAFDSQATVEEARRLRAAVRRPNVMIKVPSTPEGLPAMVQLISEGIHVNATLLFSVDVYEAVHAAYMTGLEKWVARGGDARAVSSVASFFVSRIDAAVDQRVATRLEKAAEPDLRARLEGLRARVAIANAVEAYGRFRQTLAGPRWQALAARGARPQRVLWASTGTKSPDLPTTLYVDSLIGPDTVNTVPAATFDAFRAGGIACDRLGGPAGEQALRDARALLGETEALGISLSEITAELLGQGCRLFCDAFDQLLGAVETKRRKLERAA